MAVENAEIAKVFSDVADCLEIQGANPFRIRAYRNAARTIGSWPQRLSDLLARGAELPKIPGVGADLADKIAEIARTEKLGLLEELRRKIPAGLASLLQIPDLGPKRASLLWKKLGIESLDQLKAAAREHRISRLKGFGEKLEARILGSIEVLGPAQKRIPRQQAGQVVESMLEYLRQGDKRAPLAAAGSFRRHTETVGDLDLLAAAAQGAAADKMIARFTGYPQIARVLSSGPTRATVRLRSGLQIDLRVVERPSFGAALVYFTGSKAHNIAIRKLALRKGLKVNEYGVFRGARRLGGATEQEVYDLLGLPYIEPELREDRGEVEAALAGKLPRDLVKLSSLKGDLHAHTDRTDGRLSLRELVAAARARGYEYIAVTDHTPNARIAGGQSAKELRRQLAEIDRLNDSLKGFRVLKSAEVDILENGKLDLPDEVLAELDLTVCSVHANLRLPKAKQTARLLKAIDHPRCNVLGHLTARLIQERPPIELDFEKVFRAARERNCVLEINGQPERLDLDDTHVKQARDMGLRFAISSDAHAGDQLAFIELGVHQARRGWLEARDVVNTLGARELLRALKKS